MASRDIYAPQKDSLFFQLLPLEIRKIIYKQIFHCRPPGEFFFADAVGERIEQKKATCKHEPQYTCWAVHTEVEELFIKSHYLSCWPGWFDLQTDRPTWYEDQISNARIQNLTVLIPITFFDPSSINDHFREFFGKFKGRNVSRMECLITLDIELLDIKPDIVSWAERENLMNNLRSFGLAQLTDFKQIYIQVHFHCSAGHSDYHEEKAKILSILEPTLGSSIESTWCNRRYHSYWQVEFEPVKFYETLQREPLECLRVLFAEDGANS